MISDINCEEVEMTCHEESENPSHWKSKKKVGPQERKKRSTVFYNIGTKGIH